MRLAAEAIDDGTLTQYQRKALDALRESFLADGATHGS
jgi:hypothetical protein